MLQVQFPKELDRSQALAGRSGATRSGVCDVGVSRSLKLHPEGRCEEARLLGRTERHPGQLLDSTAEGSRISLPT